MVFNGAWRRHRDTVAPSVASVTPVNGTGKVATTATVIATFSEAMDATTINTNTIQLRDSAGILVAATVVTRDEPDGDVDAVGSAQHLEDLTPRQSKAERPDPARQGHGRQRTLRECCVVVHDGRRSRHRRADRVVGVADERRHRRRLELRPSRRPSAKR